MFGTCVLPQARAIATQVTRELASGSRDSWSGKTITESALAISHRVLPLPLDVRPPGQASAVAQVLADAIEAGPPTDQELADINARLEARGIAPLQRPFVACYRFFRVRKFWGIDRRVVYDVWTHHWRWRFQHHYWMRRHGYVPHCFLDIKRWSIAPTIRNKNFRMPFNQLLESDIVYVRDPLRLDGLSDEQLRASALIAHHCLSSPDLVDHP